MVREAVMFEIVNDEVLIDKVIEAPVESVKVFRVKLVEHDGVRYSIMMPNGEGFGGFILKGWV